MSQSKNVSPSTSLKAFNCPHCYTLTTQFWRSCFVTFRDGDTLPTRIPDLEGYLEGYKKFFEEQDIDPTRMSEYATRVNSGTPFIGDKHEEYSFNFGNVDVSECYHCKKLAVWVGDKIVWPLESSAPLPNVDLPNHIIRDFREAGEIVNASPRGAAALLRLCLQNLCIHLGEKGKNINDDIASLVSKGLDSRVQKMLDTLRILGNNAVHPGEIDLRDDRETARRLFDLINLVTDIMISQPKSIDEMYGRIGDNKKQAISERDNNPD